MWLLNMMVVHLLQRQMKLKVVLISKQLQEQLKLMVLNLNDLGIAKWHELMELAKECHEYALLEGNIFMPSTFVFASILVGVAMQVKRSLL